MYSTHSEENALVAERFIRNLQNKIYKHMNSVSKILYIINKTIHIIVQLKSSLLM